MSRETAHPRIPVAAPLALAGLLLAAPAAAQVLDIQPDGAVVTYAGPAIYSSDGVRSLAPSPPLAARGPAPADVALAIQQSAERHLLSAPLVEAVAWQESRFNQAALSPKGARGVMQLMPATARQLGVDASTLAGNIDGGATYLSQMLQRFEGDLPRALAAYNAGPEAVIRYGGVPPYAETQTYVRAVLSRLAAAGAGAALRTE